MWHPVCTAGTKAGRVNTEFGFERQRFGGADRAKATGAGAAIAGDHERRRAFLPTFPMVWALGAFANRVQLEFTQQVARLRVAVGGRQLDAQPIWQAWAGF